MLFFGILLLVYNTLHFETFMYIEVLLTLYYLLLVWNLKNVYYVLMCGIYTCKSKLLCVFLLLICSEFFFTPLHKGWYEFFFTPCIVAGSYGKFVGEKCLYLLLDGSVVHLDKNSKALILHALCEM